LGQESADDKEDDYNDNLTPVYFNLSSSQHMMTEAHIIVSGKSQGEKKRLLEISNDPTKASSGRGHEGENSWLAKGVRDW